MPSLGDLIARVGADITGFEEGMGSVKQHLNRVGAAMDSLGSQLTSIGAGLTAAITAPLLGVSVAALKVAGDLEQASVAFTTLLGSADRAGQHLEALKKFAAATPFEFPDLVNASKRLQALGFTAKEIIPTLTAVGNAASALGSGAVGIERITLALGQMRAKGKVSAEEMRQLAEAGIPAWQMLADAMSKTEGRTLSVAEVMKRAEKGFIDGNMAAAALLKGLDAQFAGLMYAQSQTLTGQFSDLKDKITYLLMDIGTALAPTAKLLIASFTGVLGTIRELTRQFAELPASVQTGMLAFAGIAAAIGPVVFIAGELISSWGTVVKLMASFAPAATAAGASIGSAGLAGAMTVLGTAVAVAVAAFAAFEIGKFAFDVASFVAEVANASSIVKGLAGLIDLLPGSKTIRLIVEQAGTAASVAASFVGPKAFEIARDQLGMGGFDDKFSGFTGTIGKTLAGMKPIYKDASDDIKKYATDAAAALRAAEEAAKKHAAELKKLYHTMGIHDTGLDLKQTEHAFDAMKGSLADPQLIAAGHKLEEVLGAAFRSGTIDGKEFDRVIGKIRDSIGQLEADAQAKLANKFKVSTFLQGIESGPESFQQAGAAFQQWLTDVAVKEDEAQARLKLMTDGVAELGLELAKLPKSEQLIPPAAMKAMEDSIARMAKIAKEDYETPLKKVGVPLKSDLDTQIAANNQIQSGPYGDRIKQQSAEKTLRAVIEEEKLLTGQSTRQLELEIQLKTVRGESANAQIIQLEQIRIQQELNIERTQGMGKLYIGLMQDFRNAFDMVGKSIADNIVEGKSWAETWSSLVKSIEKMFLETLIGSAFKQLGAEIIRVSGLAGGLAKVFGVASGAGGAAGGAGGTPPFFPTSGGLLSGLFKGKTGSGEAGREGSGWDRGNVEGAGEGSGEGGGGVTSGAETGAKGGGFMSQGGAIPLVGLGVQIANGISQGIQNSRMINLLGEIEISTRQCKEQLVGGIQTVLNTYLPELKHLADIWGVQLGGFDKLILILQEIQNGGGLWDHFGEPGVRPIVGQPPPPLVTPGPAGAGPVGNREPVGFTADSARKLSRGFDVLDTSATKLTTSSGYLLKAGEYLVNPQRRFDPVGMTGVDPSGQMVTSLTDIAKWSKQIAAQGVRPEDVDRLTGRFIQPTGDPYTLSSRYRTGMEQKAISETTGAYFSPVTGDWYPAGGAAEQRKSYDGMLAKDKGYQEALARGDIAAPKQDAKWNFSDTSNPMGSLAARYAELLGRDNVTGLATFKNADPLIASLRNSGQTDADIYELLSKYAQGTDFSSTMTGRGSPAGYFGGGKADTSYAGSGLSAAYIAWQQTGGHTAFDSGNSTFTNIGGSVGPDLPKYSDTQIGTAVSLYATQLQDMATQRQAEHDAAEAQMSTFVSNIGNTLSPILNEFLASGFNREWYDKVPEFKQLVDDSFNDIIMNGTTGGALGAGHGYVDIDEVARKYAVDTMLKRWNDTGHFGKTPLGAGGQILRREAAPVNYSNLLNQYQYQLQTTPLYPSTGFPGFPGGGNFMGANSLMRMPNPLADFSSINGGGIPNSNTPGMGQSATINVYAMNPEARTIVRGLTQAGREAGIRL